LEFFIAIETMDYRMSGKISSKKPQGVSLNWGKTDNRHGDKRIFDGKTMVYK
jgi:hypothetical protein